MFDGDSDDDSKSSPIEEIVDASEQATTQRRIESDGENKSKAEWVRSRRSSRGEEGKAPLR